MPEWIKTLQNEITSALESLETSHKFQSVDWKRPPEPGTAGGGGHSRILTGGQIFEKAGVNISVVEGVLPPLMKERLNAKSAEYFAAGISLVIHPRSPCVPTVHANFRYFEQADRSWFGGGIDLTPYVLAPDDFRHFHHELKTACDTRSLETYPDFKKQCDQYFYIPHRGETRGIGGIFFDYLSDDLEKTFAFVQTCGHSFLPAYLPIVKKRKDTAFTDRQKKFQFLRRGRYVEFNLVYDRGTLFGLQTKGNIESILMSLPPEVHFDFSPSLETNDEEKSLMGFFRNPVSWTE